MRTFLGLLTIFVLATGCRFGQKANTGGKDRIVCVSKQLTELLFALHQGDKIVGVDLSSTYPPAATKLTTVGYHRLLSAEGIISLEPSVVVHQGDVAPSSVIPQLKEVGINVRQYPAANSIDSTKILIKMLADEFGQDTAAKRIIAKLETDLAAAAAFASQFTTKPRVLILHFGRQRNQYFIMGTKGPANEMVRLAGGVNAADTSSFRNLSPEAIVKTQPDVILATDFGFDRLGSKEKFADLPGIELTPAYKNGKIYRVEEHDLVYFGPRSGEVVQAFAKLIHQ